jgi:hypothetical protein
VDSRVTWEMSGRRAAGEGGESGEGEGGEGEGGRGGGKSGGARRKKRAGRRKCDGRGRKGGIVEKSDRIPARMSVSGGIGLGPCICHVTY